MVRSAEPATLIIMWKGWALLGRRTDRRQRHLVYQACGWLALASGLVACGATTSTKDGANGTSGAQNATGGASNSSNMDSTSNSTSTGGSATNAGTGGSGLSGSGGASEASTSASSATTGSGTGGAGADGSTLTPEPDPRFLCSRAGWTAPAEVVLFQTSAGVLDLIHADGHVTTVDLSYGQPEDELRDTLDVTANEDRIAVVRDLQTGEPRDALFVLFDRATGEELFRVELGDLYLRRDILLASSGNTLLNLRKPVGDAICINEPDGCDHLAVIDADGEHRIFYGLVPVGTRVGDHVLVDPAIEEWGTERGWFDIATEEITPLARFDDSARYARADEGSFRYLARAGDVVELVIETPDNVESVTVDGMAELLDAGQWLASAGSHHYFGPDENDTLFDFDMQDGSLTTRSVPVPSGWTAFGCYDDGYMVDASGTVLARVRDAQSAHLLALDAGSWQQVGSPVSELQYFEINSWGSTFLMHSWPPGSVFCQEPVWEAPPADVISGEALQLVRPQDGIHEIFQAPLPSISLNPNGTCYIHSDSNGGYALRDLFRDEDTALPVSGRPSWLDPS